MFGGDGPRFVALRAEPLARFRSFPRRLPLDEWTALVEVSGEDPADGLTDAVVTREGGDVVLLRGAARFVLGACLAACTAERWRGELCYGDLSAIFERGVPGLDPAAQAAWRLLAGTLSPPDAGDPWWVRESLHGSCAYGFLDPPALAALAEALTATDVAGKAALGLSTHYGAGDLPRLAAFFVRAAGRGDAVLGAEWS